MSCVTVRSDGPVLTGSRPPFAQLLQQFNSLRLEFHALNMAFAMLASPHSGTWGGGGWGTGVGGLDLIVALIIIALLELNALVGKQGPMASVKGVIHSSIGLTIVLVLLLQLLALRLAVLPPAQRAPRLAAQLSADPPALHQKAPVAPLAA